MLVLQIACGIMLGSVIAFFIVGALAACMLSSKISQEEDKRDARIDRILIKYAYKLRKRFDGDEVARAECMEFRD